MNPKIIEVTCDVIESIVKVANSLNCEEALKSFEKDGCLDAIEELLYHQNEVIVEKATNFVTLYSEMTEDVVNAAV